MTGILRQALPRPVLVAAAFFAALSGTAACAEAPAANGDAVVFFSAELLETFQRGGPIFWILAAILFLGTIGGVERLASLSRTKHLPRDFEKDLVHVADTKGIDAGISLCNEKPSALARVLQAALLRHGAPLSQLEFAARRTVELEKFALLRRTRLIGWLAAITPLIGFIGFVLNTGKKLAAVDHVSFDRSTSAFLAGITDGLPCLELAAVTLLVLLCIVLIGRARAADLAHDMELKAIDAVLILDRKARQSIRLIEDIEEKIKTESMIKIPDLSAEFEERANAQESAIKTAVTTHAGEPVKEAKDD